MLPVGSDDARNRIPGSFKEGLLFDFFAGMATLRGSTLDVLFSGDVTIASLGSCVYRGSGASHKVFSNWGSVCTVTSRLVGLEFCLRTRSKRISNTIRVAAMFIPVLCLNESDKRRNRFRSCWFCFCC